MALFGTLDTVRSQLFASKQFETALAHAALALTAGNPVSERVSRIQAGETLKVELGEGVFALEQAYETKAAPDVRWESHLRYLDVQVIVSGEELMEVGDARRLRVSENLTPEKDLIFYAPGAPASMLRMGAGDTAVFFPVDAHRPSLAVSEPRLVRKVVVKVPVF